MTSDINHTPYIFLFSFHLRIFEDNLCFKIKSRKIQGEIDEALNNLDIKPGEAYDYWQHVYPIRCTYKPKLNMMRGVLIRNVVVVLGYIYEPNAY